MTTIAAALANAGLKQAAVPHREEPTIFQLQTIPTSARMVKSTKSIWRGEKTRPNTVRDAKQLDNTISDRSALPFLLGGMMNLGISPSARSAVTSRVSGTAASVALPPLTARSVATRASARSRSRSPADTTPRKCAAGCSGCTRVKDDVQHFEQRHPALDDDDEAPAHIPAAAVRRRSQAKLRRRPLSPGQNDGPGEAAAAVPVVNPISGLLCCVALHEVFATYRMLTVPAPSITKHGMSVDDFHELLTLCVPGVSLSRAYVLRMFEPFAGTSMPPRAQFRDVFAFLSKTNGSATVERNTKFMFKCLDEKGTGRLSPRLFTSTIVRAWAENRVIGKAIYSWRSVAEAMAQDPMQITVNSVTLEDFRELVYSSAILTAAFQEPLECAVTDAPRWPLRAAPPSGQVKLSFRRGSLSMDGTEPSAPPSPAVRHTPRHNRNASPHSDSHAYGSQVYSSAAY